MQERCVVIRRRGSAAILSNLIDSCAYLSDERDGERLDDRDILALLAERPFAIVLPLSLPRYASLRIAELIALRRLHIRLILVSGTDAPDKVLGEMFDCHLPQCGDGLIEMLQRCDWTHAFERRSVTIDTAIQCILRTASCFWLNGGSHLEFFATLVDYQRRIAEASRHFTVLFVASDPTDAARLRLMKELAEIEHELSKRSEYSFTIKFLLSSRPDELTRKLLEEKPHIVHFSGHGDASGRLCFEDASGRSWPADKAAIAQIFEPSRRHLKCVVLNACFSAEQAHLLGEHVEYAIGLRSSVSDEAAIAMTRGFYGALSVTGRVSSALEAARASLRLLSSDNTELLYCAKRVPEFGGFTPGTMDTTKLDPTLLERLAEMTQLVAGDIVVPIPPGARCETAGYPEFSANERGAINARFIVPSSMDMVFALYLSWAQRDGWFIEILSEGGAINRLHVAKGIHRTTVMCAEDEDEDEDGMFLRMSIMLDQTPSARCVCCATCR